MSFASFCLLTIVAHVPSAEAGGLRRQPLPAQMNRTDIETLLMSELSNSFRGGAPHERISNVEAELVGMYTAVPKDASGRLGHAAVRYMLHRFFSQKHGWFIRGLEPGNASALQAVTPDNQKLGAPGYLGLQEWVSGYLQKFIEEMQGGRGINSRELAVLAVTLEDLIHKEANQRLETVFLALELPFDKPLNQEQVREAIELYTLIYINEISIRSGREGHFLLKNDAEIKARDIRPTYKAKAKKVPDWENVKQWTHAIQVEVAPVSIDKPMDFASLYRVTDEVGTRFGRYNEAMCGDLQSQILQIESTKAGRVRLADFYKSGLTGVFRFNEKIEYLRALGTMDESNTSEPYVILANYVASRPNCLRTSEFYVVCCGNECEGLLATVEKKLKKPMANPEEILELVASFSTKTVKGPRTLSDTLVQRLNRIADANHGQVPLHGRLFAQWMHHAFPRECPYPQPSGGVAPMTADKWMQATGHKSASKTNEEVQVFVESDSCMLPVGEKAREHHDLAENELPWDETEELLHPAKDSANNVVTLEAAILKAPQRSLFTTAMPVFFILGSALFAWKMTRDRKGSGWRDGLV